LIFQHCQSRFADHVRLVCDQAIDYALKRWEALTRFIADGTLEIDNNLVENAIRPSPTFADWARDF
jgi:hypothetical protein